MKFRWNKSYLGWGLTAFFVIVGSIIVCIALLNLDSIMSAVGTFFGAIQPIFYGFIIAYLLAPIMTFFETRCFNKLFKQKKNEKAEAPESELSSVPDGEIPDAKYDHLEPYVKNTKSRILSIIVTMLIFIGIIVGIGTAIIPQLGSTITLLASNIPGYIDDTSEWVKGALADYPQIAEELTNIINEAGSTFKNFLSTSILPQIGDYFGFLTSGIMSLIGFVLNIIFGLVVSIYCLFSKELFASQMKKVIYCIFSVKHANGIISSARKIHKSFGGFITGTLIDSFVVACLTFIVTTIFNVPFALLVSVVMGVMNIIPYFGPFIGIVPCLLLIFLEEPIMCLVFLAIALVIQNLNGNIISPRILGESTGLSSFWVVFAILAGQGIFGFWGLIIGIPLFAVIFSTAKTLISGRLVKKGLPPDSGHYSDIESIGEKDLVPVSLSETIKKEQEAEEKKELEERMRKKLKREERLERIKAKTSKNNEKR